MIFSEAQVKCVQECTCTHCGSLPGYACATPMGRVLKEPHLERVSQLTPTRITFQNTATYPFLKATRVEIPKVIGVTVAGGCWRNGVYSPGWGKAYLSDGKEITTPENLGFDGVLALVDKQGTASTREYRERLSEWVKTGTMPFAK